MEHNIYLVIPFYNIEKYILECVGSLLSQNYNNWKAILIDDSSKDDTFSLIPNHKKIKKIKNEKRVGALENTHNGILMGELNDDDIVAIIDGDDRLLHSDSLKIVNWFYNKENCLLSYGDFVSNYNLPPICTPYETEEEFNNLRNLTYRATHLRTFKYKVYKELMKQDPDLNCYRRKSDNNFYTITSDVAMMHPLMEISGYNNVHFNKIPIYWYRLHDANDFNTNRTAQLEAEIEINKKEKFKRIF